MIVRAPEKMRRVARRFLGRGAAPDSQGAKDASHYDAVYRQSDEYLAGYESSRYYSIWTVIMDRIRRSPGSRVLEIGCGSGQLASLLRDQGITEYVGFDFSEVAIDVARRRTPNPEQFVVADALTSDLYEAADYDTVVCTEVLEHVDEDLDIIGRIRPGARCLCTVPNFPYEGHVRHFADANEVRARYERYFDDFDVLALRGAGRPELMYFLFEGVRGDAGSTD